MSFFFFFPHLSPIILSIPNLEFLVFLVDYSLSIFQAPWSGGSGGILKESKDMIAYGVVFGADLVFHDVILLPTPTHLFPLDSFPVPRVLLL